MEIVSLPEVEPEFDDSDFVTADQTATNVCSVHDSKLHDLHSGSEVYESSPAQWRQSSIFSAIWVSPFTTGRDSNMMHNVPTSPSFYGGNLIFRGHFNASGEETAFLLTVQGGFVFGYSAFLNGVFLGSNQGSPTVSLTSDSWTVPNGTLRIGQDNVLTVIQGAEIVTFCIDTINGRDDRSHGVRALSFRISFPPVHVPDLCLGL